MGDLEKLSTGDHRWGLDEFVALANNLVPSYVSSESTDARMKETLSARLVRSYATLGLLDEPQREGRNARYTYRHLLQLLVIRRLLSDGLSTSAIGERVSRMSNQELEQLLEGGVQVELSVANPALAFLRGIQVRDGSGQIAKPGSRQASPSSSIEQSTWKRLVLMDGLEVSVRDDFPVPHSETELENVINRIRDTLKMALWAKNTGRHGKHGNVQR